MKVKDLLSIIQKAKIRYPNIDEWTIALEQHPDYKQCDNCNKKEDYIIIKDKLDIRDNELFIKSHSIGCVYFYKQKVLGIQIHY